MVRWLVAEGDPIRRDQPLVEVETDKAVVQIPSPVEGTVTGLMVAEGSRASVGDPLAEIAGARATRAAGPRALPRVRALATELGVDLGTLRPAGESVSEEEVRAAAEGSSERVPLRGVRREIAEHMTDAAAVPTVTVVEECDFSALAGVAPYARAAALIGATAEALAEHPELNTTVESGELVRHAPRHLGYAVQGAHGLVVPVIHDAHELGADQLAARVESLVEAARAGSLTPEQMRGATFTITDARRLGGLFATPLLNTPQVGILGVHRVAERPVVREGEVVARPVALLSVGFDHRALDGSVASAFLLDVIGRIEGWRPGA